MNEHAAHPPTARELYLRFRKRGDREAFEALVHRFEGELYRYLKRYLRNAALAEDVFQSTFMQLYQKAPYYNEARRFRPWLYSIATHLAVDALRKAGREHAVSLDESMARASEDDDAPIDVPAAGTATPFQEALDEERRELARHAVDELPEHLRVVVLLVFFQGLKYSEAAEALRIPLGTFKSRMHAAFKKLNEALRKPQPLGTSHLEPAPRESREAEQTIEPHDLDGRQVEVVHGTLASLADGDLDSESPIGLVRSVCLRVRETDQQKPESR